MSNTPDWLQNINPGPSFSDEMVRAVMEGRKTQTRRTIDLPEHYRKWEFSHYDDGLYRFTSGWGASNVWHKMPAPYQPGEIYYLRETIAVHCLDCMAGPIYTADNQYVEGVEWVNEDGSERKVASLSGYCMPRRAARTFLRITDVRVEQVQDISEADAQAEGWDMSNMNLRDTYDPVTMDTARQWFKMLWCDIHSPESWKANPWVWVLEFEMVTREKAKEGGKDDE